MVEAHRRLATRASFDVGWLMLRRCWPKTGQPLLASPTLTRLWPADGSQVLAHVANSTLGHHQTADTRPSLGQPWLTGYAALPDWIQLNEQQLIFYWLCPTYPELVNPANKSSWAPGAPLRRFYTVCLVQGRTLESSIFGKWNDDIIIGDWQRAVIALAKCWNFQ